MAATKLKIFSFVAYTPHCTITDISAYTDASMDYALDNYKGLPRGLQNGVVSFNVLASDNVDIDAINYAVSRPKKHFAAMRMPVIFDLGTGKLAYYEKTPMWGGIYYKYFREYIKTHFTTFDVM
ncbi:MAG: hypothetical protein FWG10_07905 [Eubacteriaceae bacterium]|nr:hypothetical protein [Eubacteriaceae bacterium]